MSPSNRLTAREYAFFGLGLLFWAGFVIVLGKDTSWDFRNYHWYGPYALFNHRMGIDMAVAHQASYYNPYLDIPFYWLATHTRAWIALGVLGAAQGANMIPLYLIARSALRVKASESDIKLMAGALSLLGMVGALTLTEFGTTYYDNVMSVFVLSGLAILVLKRDILREGPLGEVGASALHHQKQSQAAADRQRREHGEEPESELLGAVHGGGRSARPTGDNHQPALARALHEQPDAGSVRQLALRLALGDIGGRKAKAFLQRGRLVRARRPVRSQDPAARRRDHGHRSVESADQPAGVHGAQQEPSAGQRGAGIDQPTVPSSRRADPSRLAVGGLLGRTCPVGALRLA